MLSIVATCHVSSMINLLMPTYVLICAKKMRPQGQRSRSQGFEKCHGRHGRTLLLKRVAGMGCTSTGLRMSSFTCSVVIAWMGCVVHVFGSCRNISHQGYYFVKEQLLCFLAVFVSCCYYGEIKILKKQTNETADQDIKTKHWLWIKLTGYYSWA